MTIWRQELKTQCGICIILIMCLQDLSLNRPAAYHTFSGSGYNWERDAAWRCSEATKPTLAVYSWLHGRKGRRGALNPSPTTRPLQTALKLEQWTRLSLTAQWDTAWKATALPTKPCFLSSGWKWSTVCSPVWEPKTPSHETTLKWLNNVSPAPIRHVYH